MQHLGDITKINGAKVPVVDCITGGSPCQDLSIAGKRAGLEGERSGLFMEQIRIVKEMREHDRRTNHRTAFNIRPRYMVWENVPGAFSSNKGQDFQAVLSEIVKIANPEAPDVPLPDRGGRWDKAGGIFGYSPDGIPFSVCWRLHDAQFWGVPQRRKRIALVADFGGFSASEILFEREGVRGDFEESGAEREETAGGTGKSTESTSRCLTGWDCQSKRIFDPESVCGALNSGTTEGVNIVPSVFCLQGNGIARADSAGCNGKGRKEDISYTLNTIDRPAVVTVLNDQGGDVVDLTHEPVPLESHPHDSRVKISKDGIVQTLSSRMGTGGGNTPMVMDTFHLQEGREISPALKARDYKEPLAIIQGENVARMPDEPMANVRRLTPLECERLQGFPDNWTDLGEWTDTKGKLHKPSDSPRYKALGNSIALPFWFWLLRRISAQYERPATMASLFDGIGGFPLCWEKCNGKGSALWASEIEEFPIAVTKRRFSE